MLFNGFPSLVKQGLPLLALGFSSAIPFLLTLSTLSVWLVESGATAQTVGLFSLMTLPYAFKFLWSPAADRLRLPFLTDRLGKRRSWALLSQLCLMLSLVALGTTNPYENLWLTALFALCVAFCASFQDLVIEAYRIETTGKGAQGLSATSIYIGFRLGLMTSGAGALYLATFLSWFWVYALMACCIAVGMVTIFFVPEPAETAWQPQSQPWRAAWQTLTAQRNWMVLLIFLLSYKAADTILHVMDMPFLMGLGYTKLQIAEIVRLFGIAMMMLGGVCSGYLLSRLSLRCVLCVSVILQILSCIGFIVQALVGYAPGVLMGAVALENLACGVGTTALLAFYALLCHAPYTATHYAFLSSTGSIARIVWSALGGVVAEHVSWSFFFFLTALCCLPALALLWHKDFSKPDPL